MLSEKRRVLILIDNLDEPWGPGRNVQRLAELLDGLLTLAADLPDDLGRHDSWRRSVNARVTVLLRSDIFAFIHPLAVEQDKLPVVRIVWNDPEQLLRMLDERLVHQLPSGFAARDVWAAVFPDQVAGIPCTDFILNTVLPRPRDIVYLVSQALGCAVDRGHTSVEEGDFLTARNQYAEYVLRSVLKEDNPEKGFLESVLIHFARAPRQVTRSECETRLAEAGVPTEETGFYLDLLCDIGFLAVQTASGFKFTGHEGERQVMRLVASELAKQAGDVERFEISRAFHHILGIE